MLSTIVKKFCPQTPEVIRLARVELGTCEDPLGSNKTIYGREYDSGPWVDEETAYQYNGQAWCAIFGVVMYWRSGVTLPPWQYERYPGAASVSYLKAGFEKEGWLVTTPKPGDFVFYDWSHVGLIDKVYDNSILAIEGNTTQCGGSESYYVWEHLRPRSRCVAFGRVGG